MTSHGQAAVADIGDFEARLSRAPRWDARRPTVAGFASATYRETAWADRGQLEGHHSSFGKKRILTFPGGQ
jgi:hypothetical protein